MIIIAKTEVRTMNELRAKSKSSVDISRALADAKAEFERVSDIHKDMKAQRVETVFSPMSGGYERQKAAVDELGHYLNTLDNFITDLEAQLPAAIEHDVQKVSALKAEWDDLDAHGKSVQFAERFKRDYPKHAKAIADLMRLEQEADTAVKRACRIAKELTALGVETPEPIAAYRHATGGPLTVFASIGAMVKLPGVLGAPAIPRVYTRIEKTVDVERADWDAPQHGKDHTGLPRARKIVQETVEEHVFVTDREDEAFWWLRNDPGVNM